MSITSLKAKIKKRLKCETFKDSKLAEVDHWISTGAYALNRIVSGSIYGGIPSGRVISLGGISASGKSYIMANIVANALNENKYDLIFFLDSEIGTTTSMWEAMGCDTDKILHIPVSDVEEWAIAVAGIYADIEEEQIKTPELRALICTDSIGALVPAKYATDIEKKGKVVADQGARAKSINNCVKKCTVLAAKTNSSFIGLNHIYDNPGDMHASKVKQQSGGHGFVYMTTVGIQCEKSITSQNRSEDSKGETYYDSNTLRFITVKNRCCKPFVMTELEIDFNKGIHKFAGLLEPAVKYGFIEKRHGGRYVIPSWNTEKSIFLKELMDGEHADEIWGTFLPAFDEISKADLAYGSSEEMEDLDKIVTADLKEADLKSLKEETMGLISGDIVATKSKAVKSKGTKPKSISDIKIKKVSLSKK